MAQTRAPALRGDANAFCVLGHAERGAATDAVDERGRRSNESRRRGRFEPVCFVLRIREILHRLSPERKAARRRKIEPSCQHATEPVDFRWHDDPMARWPD